MSAADFLKLLAGAILGAVGTWLRFKKQIADLEKLIAETEKARADTEKALVDTQKSLAETKKTLGEVELQKFHTTAAHIEIQDKLNQENAKYKEALDRFTDKINALAALLGQAGADGSTLRNDSIKELSDTVYVFNKYLEKAKEYYRHESSYVVRTVIESEIIPFLRTLAEAVDALNDQAILDLCVSSKVPFKPSDSSLGPVKIALHLLVPVLSADHRSIIESELRSVIGSSGTLPKLEWS